MTADGRRRPAGVSIADWLMERSVMDGACRRWIGAHNPKGYGQLTEHGRVRPVHQLAYEAWVGPIPEGYEVDHVKALGCRWRDCINPMHLEAVTHRENVRRTHDHLTRLVQGDLLSVGS